MLKLLSIFLHLSLCCFGLPKGVPARAGDRPRGSAAAPGFGHDEGREVISLAPELDSYHLDCHEWPLRFIETHHESLPFPHDGFSPAASGKLLSEHTDGDERPGVRKREAIACFREKPWLRKIDFPSCQPVLRQLAALGFLNFAFRSHHTIRFPNTNCELRIDYRDRPVGNLGSISADYVGTQVARVLGECDHIGYGGIKPVADVEIALGSWYSESTSFLQFNSSASLSVDGEGTSDASAQSTATRRTVDASSFETELAAVPPSATSLARPEPSIQCSSALEPSLMRLNEAACYRILTSLDARRQEKVQVMNEDIIPFGAGGCDVVVEAEGVKPHEIFRIPADDLYFALHSVLQKCKSSRYGGHVQLAPFMWTMAVENKIRSGANISKRETDVPEPGFGNEKVAAIVEYRNLSIENRTITPSPLSPLQIHNLTAPLSPVHPSSFISVVKCFHPSTSTSPHYTLQRISLSVCTSLLNYIDSYAESHLRNRYYRFHLSNNVPTSFQGSMCELKAFLPGYPTGDLDIPFTTYELVSIVRAVLERCKTMGYGGYVPPQKGVTAVGAGVAVANWGPPRILSSDPTVVGEEGHLVTLTPRSGPAIS